MFNVEGSKVMHKFDKGILLIEFVFTAKFL